jgi:hypothetical protein
MASSVKPFIIRKKSNEDITQLSLSERLRLRLGGTGTLSILGPSSPKAAENASTKTSISTTTTTSSKKRKAENSNHHQEKYKNKKVNNSISNNNDNNNHNIIENKDLKIIEKLWKIILHYTIKYDKRHSKQDAKKKLSSLSLADIKFCARFFNYADEGWQHIGKKHSSLLIDELYINVHEIHLFRENVIKCMKKSQKKINKLKKWNKKLPDSYLSSIHIIPSGSGVLVSDNHGDLTILTCSHCIHESAEDDDNNSSTRARNKRKNASTRNVKNINNHKGRYKIIILNDGSLHVAQCIYNNDLCDVAFLKFLFLNNNDEDSKNSESICNSINNNIKTAEVATTCAETGDAVYCIHNPYDWDLELENGAQPRRNGFIPFTISEGTIDGYVDDNVKKKSTSRIHVSNDLGALMHGCWTYWGSSGAPIFNKENGNIVGIHNSWDPSCGQRHGVGIEGIRFCINEMMTL